MSTALTVVSQPGSAVVAGDWSLADTMQLGKVLAASGYFRDVRDASQAVAKILLGRELGIGPMTALMSVHVVEGKPAPSANLIAARVKSSGRYDYRVREHTTEVCRIEFFERTPGGPESLGLIEWTMEDARRAGLASRGPWKTYPRAMLFARAMSEGARTHCPEVFGGAAVYTPEELGADVDADGHAVLPAPPPRETEATEAQLDLVQQMMRSHRVTDSERAGIERRLGAGMTREQASQCIDWLKEEIEARRAVEEMERAEAEEVAP